ncbi:MAG: HNH endonuclease signature motif containing protein [bacterium]
MSNIISQNVITSFVPVSRRNSAIASYLSRCLMSDFQPGLPADEVHRSLLDALQEYRRAEQNVVLWFAEVKKRRLFRPLGHGSIQQYAEQALHFSRSKTFQLLRLVDSLEKLPQLKQAVADGKIGWTKAREVAKVASPRTEARWVAMAQDASRRELEREVARTKKRAAKVARRNPAQKELLVTAASQNAEPSDAGIATEVPVALTLQMTPLQRARFDALLEKVRKSGAATAGKSREEILLVALESMAQPEPRAASDSDSEQECTRVHSASPYQIVVYQCEHCKEQMVQVAGERRKIAPAQAEAIACDARILEPGPGQRNRATIPPGKRRQVLARDGFRCQSPGCRHSHFLELHHLKPCVEGGRNSPENLITLCSSCHRLAHEHPGVGALLADRNGERNRKAS